ncbi:hypothetical protein MNB_SV-9-885 [hydrothermal vent metagenome]|uniref:Uncharacterized protein n=1 Tax=hydrothermal vent metagenome TaxID=652676 RepID=A0A1W1BIU9_9ZZZZ
MKKVSLSISGKRYEVNLDEEFADFVLEDMKNAGISEELDNQPALLLKAYLKLAYKNSNYEEEIELLIETLDGF